MIDVSLESKVVNKTKFQSFSAPILGRNTVNGLYELWYKCDLFWINDIYMPAITSWLWNSNRYDWKLILNEVQTIEFQFQTIYGSSDLVQADLMSLNSTKNAFASVVAFAYAVIFFCYLAI